MRWTEKKPLPHSRVYPQRSRRAKAPSSLRMDRSANRVVHFRDRMKLVNLEVGCAGVRGVGRSVVPAAT